MPSVVLRSALRARIRSATQQPNPGGLFSDATLNDMIREAVNTVYDALIAARGTHYYSTVTYLPTVAGQATVDLPSDFYRLCAVLINPQPVPVINYGYGQTALDGEALGTGWRELPRLVMRELDMRRNLPGTDAWELAYEVTGVQSTLASGATACLRLYPTPRAAFGLQIVYLPVCAHVEMAGVGGAEVSYDLINGWEAAVVAHVAEEICATQEDSTVAYWQAKKAEHMARIAALAADRDEAQPFQIADRRDLTDPAWRDPRRDPWG